MGPKQLFHSIVVVGAALTGCGDSETTGMDSSVADTANDSAAIDSGSMDAASDTLLADATPGDTAEMDAAMEDTGGSRDVNNEMVLIL